MNVLTFLNNFHKLVIVVCLHRLAVRTPGFHPGNRGSIPRGDVIKRELWKSSLFIFEFRMAKLHTNLRVWESKILTFPFPR